MTTIVPPQFLFRWSFVARKIENVPRSARRLLDLPDDCELLSLGELDQRNVFARVRMAWNERGVAVSVAVSGRSQRLKCEIGENHFTDGVGLWFDTRSTQSVHRATKFCHHFVILPSGGGSKRSDPIVRSLPVARAREETALADADLIRVQSEVSATGYWLDAWLPRELFAGFDPVSNPKIGFHYSIRDSEFGEQTLAVDRDFPYESDPSLWQTVELSS